MPPEIQDYILTLVRCQLVYERNKLTKYDKVLSEIRSYGRLQEAWGHGFIILAFPHNWLPRGQYTWIASIYMEKTWWIGVDCTIDEAIDTLDERRMDGLLPRT